MAFTMFGRTIRKIGVIGSGNIGPDIALHFSQNLYSYGVPIVIVDILQAALDSGSKKAESKVAKAVEKKIYKKEEGDAIFRNILFTTDYGKLTDADLVIEAALVEYSMKLYEFIGKAPIRVGSRFGFAVNPFFEGMFLATILAVEKGLATVKPTDTLVVKTLGKGGGT